MTSDDDTSSSCESRSYDLSAPPSREDLGMEPGESVMDVSCDAGFELRLALPEWTTTSLTARRVNADSYGSGNSETGDPTTMDVHSIGLDVDQAITIAQGIADDLKIDAKPLQRWRFDVKVDESGNVDSPFMRAKVGYLTAELQVQHLGASGENYIHLILTW